MSGLSLGCERVSSGRAAREPVSPGRIKDSIMCKWTRPFWGTDGRRSPKSLSSAQAASLCSAGLRELESACRLSIL